MLPIIHALVGLVALEVVLLFLLVSLLVVLCVSLALPLEH